MVFLLENWRLVMVFSLEEVESSENNQFMGPEVVHCFYQALLLIASFQEKQVLGISRRPRSERCWYQKSLNSASACCLGSICRVSPLTWLLLLLLLYHSRGSGLRISCSLVCMNPGGPCTL